MEFEWEQVTGYEDKILQNITLLYKWGVQKQTESKQVSITQVVKLSDSKWARSHSEEWPETFPISKLHFQKFPETVSFPT